MSEDQPKVDPDAANFRITMITSFLLAATMIDLSLNVPIIRQSAASGLSVTEWLFALSIPLTLFSTMIMLFTSYVVLATMYLVPLLTDEKMRRVGWARTLVGVASFLIPTSFGSTFIVSLGLSSPWSLIFGGIGYGSGIVWAIVRGYYQIKYVRVRKA